MQSTAAASERVFEFLDEEEMKDESAFKEYLDKSVVKGKIEFENVVFKYDDNDVITKYFKNIIYKVEALKNIIKCLD